MSNCNGAWEERESERKNIEDHAIKLDVSTNLDNEVGFGKANQTKGLLVLTIKIQSIA